MILNWKMLNINEELLRYSNSPTYRYHFRAGMLYLKGEILQAIKNGTDIKKLLDEIQGKDELVFGGSDRKD